MREEPKTQEQSHNSHPIGHRIQPPYMKQGIVIIMGVSDSQVKQIG